MVPAGLPLVALLAATVNPPLRHVTLLHIADTHAQLETHPEYMPGEDPPYPQMGGFARLKTAIDRARHDSPATFVADGGDTFQGSAPAAWSEGEAVVGPLNGLGLDVCVPGNWEVVYGPGQFKKLMGELSCAVLAYNFHDVATGRRLFAPAKLIDRGGVRVVFVGITDPTTTQRQPPNEVRGLDSTRMQGLRDFLRELKKTQRPDLLVAVTHSGLTVSRQIARENPELDVILSGHTHERTFEPVLEGRTIIVEPGSMGSFLGRLDLDVGPEGGIVRHRFELIPVRASQFPEDPAEKKLVEAAVAPYRARMDRVVGRSETPIARYDVLETSADNLVADVVRETSGADIGSTNGFRYSPPILAGPVTEGQLWSLLPLDARMKMGWITGRELGAYLERELELVFSKDPWKLSGGWGPRLSGVELRFAAKAAPGHRLVSVRVNGQPLQDDRRYTIAGCERAGEPIDVICRLAGVHDVKVLPMSVHQALDAYFAAHAVVAPKQEGRAAATDLAPRVFSQDAILSK
jgi:2',3'-cyclic-nucleotide 2'-phosphodiesterase (5'-nucleotidase family)